MKTQNNMKVNLISFSFLASLIISVAFTSSVSVSATAGANPYEFYENEKCWSALVETEGDPSAESIISITSEGILVGGRSSFKASGKGKDGYYVWLKMLTRDGKAIWGEKYQDIKISALPVFLKLKDGVFIAGNENIETPIGTEYYIVKAKVANDGKQVWVVKDKVERYGFVDYAVQLPDGSIILKHGMKTHHYDKLDNNGKLISRKTSGEYPYAADLGTKLVEPNQFESIIALSEDGYSPNYDIKRISISDSGEILSETTFKKNAGEYVNSLVELKNGGAAYVYNNEFEENIPVYDATLIRTDAEGKTIWKKTFGGPGNDDPMTILETPDNGLLIIGTTTSFGKCFDSNGSDKCEKNSMTIQGMNSKYQYPSNIFILKTDSDGKEIWARVIGDVGYDTVRAATLDSDGAIVATGYYVDPSSENMSKSFITKINGDGTCGAGTSIKLSGNNNESDVSPKKESERSNGAAKSATPSNDDKKPVVNHEIKKEKAKKDIYDIYVNDSCWVRKTPIPTWGKTISLAKKKNGDGFVAAYTSSDDPFESGGIKQIIIGYGGDGAMEWTTSIKGSFVNSIESLKDGDYLVSGGTPQDNMGVPSSNPRHSTLTKLNNKGEFVWNRSYPGNEAQDVVELSDGFYAFTGVTSEEFLSLPVVTRVNKEGNEAWTTKIPFDFPVFGYSRNAAVEESNGNIVFAGYYSKAEMPGNIPVSLILVNNSGKKVKEAPYPEKDISQDTPEALVRSDDQGYVMGITRSYFTKKVIYKGGANELSGENYQARVMKVDKKGNFEWGEDFGTERYDAVSSLINTSDGGYLLLATTSTEGPCYTEKLDECDFRELKDTDASTNIWLIKLNGRGEKMWGKAIGSAGLNTAGSVIQASDGSYILSASTSKIAGEEEHSIPEGIIMKVDSNGVCDLDLEKLEYSSFTE